MKKLPIEELAISVTEVMYENDPTLMDRYGDKGRRKCIEDNEHHFKHLQTAYELQNGQFFTEYALWLNGILSKYGMTEELLIENFKLIDDLLEREYKEYEATNDLRNYLASAVQSLQESALTAAEKGRG
ncbi:hypothetical protein ACFFJY_19235 [Fictibacillus aquaticus]|uniref:Uncharacterized protein n=1 Tax=Fictibacillus aquaticus TaxID=2021314 RepID=A0A235F4Z6_9BACL|nr:hypothetical protein [Fictibacillus aquaticus]OYD56278.1 hypothetical protein CGZ90_18175 [Fictibacillus aquaticus]